MERIDGYRWRKSSYSGSNGGNCIEVQAASDAINVRDSKDAGGPKLAFGLEAWGAFAARVKADVR
jgi:Domain of unknown function (DUF397)